MTSPATGTATRLATVPTSESRPKTRMLGMATPAWAPIVTATGIASGPNRCKRPASHGPTPVTPAVAPTDNQNPTDQASSGSMRSSTTTATASERTASRSRPSA